MKNELIKKNLWDEFPTYFGGRDLFRTFNSEFDKILNGKCNFEEEDDKYIIELEVPGVKKDEINLGLKNDVLTISWNRKNEHKSKSKNVRYERSEGSFNRSFDVEGVNPEKIEAELKNGVLKIVLYKNENFRPKKIEIK